MNNLLIYCLCLDDHLLAKVKKLNYIPVGLGKNNFSDEWLRDNTMINISEKKILFMGSILSITGFGKIN